MAEETSTFRILVVDDEHGIKSTVEESLNSYRDSIDVDGARTTDEATDAITAKFYDLILLDLYSEAEGQFGVEVYRRTEDEGISTPVIFMTQFTLREDLARLLQLMTSRSARRVVGFLDKTANFGAAIRGEVGPRVASFVKSRASIDGLPIIAGKITKQRGRYKSRDGSRIVLRNSIVEVSTEIDRLLGKLYVDLPGAVSRRSQLKVSLSAGDRRGLSAAAVVNATISVLLDGLSTRSFGQKTVLKVGPKDDIFEEATRFIEYVRYGVELAERVELLGLAGGDSLGGLVYSFAGGVYNHDLVALDQVLVEDISSGDLSLSTTVLQRLFQSKNWYSVSGEPVDVGDYFSRNYRTDLRRSRSEGERSLLGLNEKWGGYPLVSKSDDRASRVGAVVESSRGRVINFPDSSVLGWSPLLYGAKTCLVHGDMHGGNVLLETSSENGGTDGRSSRRYRRTCLIDFRNSGPGPRCIDAVSLELSVRLAHAEVLRRTYKERQDLLGPKDRSEFADDLVALADEELRLYRFVFLGDTETPDSDWSHLCLTVLQGLKSCFEEEDISLREYLATSIRYTIRGLGFPMSDTSRLRLTAWLGAQFELARDLQW